MVLYHKNLIFRNSDGSWLPLFGAINAYLQNLLFSYHYFLKEIFTLFVGENFAIEAVRSFL